MNNLNSIQDILNEIYFALFFIFSHDFTQDTFYSSSGKWHRVAVATVIFLSTLRNYVNIYLKKCKNLIPTVPLPHSSLFFGKQK